MTDQMTYQVIRAHLTEQGWQSFVTMNGIIHPNYLTPNANPQDSSITVHLMEDHARILILNILFQIVHYADPNFFDILNSHKHYKVEIKPIGGKKKQ